jgi:ubiquitin-protein ligase
MADGRQESSPAVTPVGTRARRIENEWVLLNCMVSDQNELLSRVQRTQEEFSVVLHGTMSPVVGKSGVMLESTHEVRLVFPRFFPATPVEVYLQRPVFHPNVHPLSGFACLWSEWSPIETVCDALRQLQAVLTYRRWNGNGDHLMQPDALDWAMAEEQSARLPLSSAVLRTPEGWKHEPGPRQAPSRRRLS